MSSTSTADIFSDRPVMILLVDDQVIVGEAVRRALVGEPGLALHYCSNPLEALAVAQKLRPAIILQDLVMPGVNGLDLVRQYRADPITGDIPIIVLSTKEEPTIKRDAFGAGANDYIVKLPDRIELIARLRYHSTVYRMQVERDEAYRALRESQQRLIDANLELQRLTNVDGLTGLANKRYFTEFVEAEWKRALRGSTPLSLLMIDVDHFKLYNDNYGHLAGDEVLRRIARVFEQSFARSTDLAARFGGEEFAVVLPEVSVRDIETLGARTARTVEELHLPHVGSTTSAYVTVSVGAATAIPRQDESFFRLVDAADQALYKAKRGGRNRSQVFEG